MFIDLTEENINVKETLIGCFPHVPWPGIEPTTKPAAVVCALTGNQTHNPSVHSAQDNTPTNRATQARVTFIFEVHFPWLWNSRLPVVFFF